MLLSAPKNLNDSLLRFFIILSTKLLVQINARTAMLHLILSLSYTSLQKVTSLRIVTQMYHLFQRLSLTNFPTLPIHFRCSTEMYSVLPPLVHVTLYKQTCSSQEMLDYCSTMVNKVTFIEKPSFKLLEQNSNKLIPIFSFH